MTILFVGAAPEAFTFNSSFETGTSSSRLNTTYTTYYWTPGTGNPASSAYMECINFASQTEVWLHMSVGCGGWASNNYNWVAFVNSTGTEIFRIRSVDTSGNLRAQYWDGSAYQNIGATINQSASGRSDWDIHLICGASGSFEIFKDNISVCSGSHNDADVNNVVAVRFYTGSNSTSTSRATYSEIVIATTQTTDLHVFQRAPTGNGNYTTWAGSYTDVDEQGYSDADFISGTTNGEKESFTTGARTIGSLEVKAIAVHARAKRDTGGPQNLQMMLRNGSTDHFSSNVPGLTTTYGPVEAIWELDPATSSKWSATDAGNASLNFGVQAIT